jgi:sigma-B regulation protein RsbU (phosphoserine phosphatase)
MSPEVPPLRSLPDPVRQTLRDFERALGLRFRVFRLDGHQALRLLYSSEKPSAATGAVEKRRFALRDGPTLELEITGIAEGEEETHGYLAQALVERSFEFSNEVRFFTYELSERYEEINLLYSISETLGSLLRLDDAARVILGEVCDVLGANRGSLWVFRSEEGVLELVAAVGEEGMEGPLLVEDPEAVTAKVFREGRPLMGRPDAFQDSHPPGGDPEDSFLSVPIRYSPPAGLPRTVGVINLVGRRRGGRFTASDQKLLAAIASQVGSALENHRLLRESLAQERVSREMELAHHLQMKLLPAVENFEGAMVAARVEPAEQVGGDFYHLFHLTGGRIGVMIGDVSTHGFPAALIMALSMSAAAIYAMEVGAPAGVLRSLDDALRDELETTEMYLSLFYGVLDPALGELTYSNAGHPHAFVIHPDGNHERLLATDPPVGIAGPGSFHERSMPWAAGEDLLLLFTDGLSDTLAFEDRGSGEDVVVEAAVAGRHGPPQAIVDSLFAWAADADSTIPADDRTALILRV